MTRLANVLVLAFGGLVPCVVTAWNVEDRTVIIDSVRLHWSTRQLHALPPELAAEIRDRILAQSYTQLNGMGVA